MIRDHDKMVESAFATMPSSSNVNEDRFEKPRYQIISNDKEFRVALDVPGVAEKDIHVELEKDGKFLTISGSRESKGEGYQFSSKFAQSFSVEPNVDINRFTAQLQNGVLEISAPKDVKRIESSRKIPVIVKADESPAIEAGKSNGK